MAQRKRVLARREKPKIKSVRRKGWNKANDYSKGKKCPDCGKAITNRSTRCRVCSRKHRKEKAVMGWRKALLGKTEPPKPSDPIGFCELCDQDERTPDSPWCHRCQAWIDGEYAQRSLAVA